MKKRMGMLVFVLIVCAALGLTLLACDSSEQSGYSVAFEANGGSAVESLSGVTEVAEAPSSVRTGYTLEGWYLASDLSGEAVTFPLTVTADTTLYAKWSANTYTVSFDYTTADGGIGESSIEVAFGSALGTLPAPTMTGNTFAGWYDGDTLYTADSLMPAGDLELSAVFAANTYRLTFDTTVEGLAVEDVSVTFAAAVPALPAPEREGYTFRVSPMIAYALRDNMAIGARFVYARSLLKLDNASLKFGDDVDATEFRARDFYTLTHSYTASVIWRQYIPLGNSKRFALFNEMQLSAGGSQAKFANDSPVKGTYQTGYSLSLGISPGIVAFATNNMAVEVNVGVMGISYNHVKQVHNQVREGKLDTSMMNFKVNIFSIGLGMAFYL